MTREHSPKPGITWQTIVQQVETVVPDGGPTVPNRATRRACARSDRKTTTMPKTVLGQLLTPRERDVLRFLVQGHTAWDIAKALRCSVPAVQSRIGKACRKLGARNADQATQILAAREGKQ